MLSFSKYFNSLSWDLINLRSLICKKAIQNIYIHITYIFYKYKTLDADYISLVRVFHV